MSCPECEAEFNASHDMDEKMYTPKNCIFCGVEVQQEDIYEEEE